MIKKIGSYILLFSMLACCFGGCGKQKTALQYEDVRLTEGMYHYLFASLKNYYLTTFTDITDDEDGWNQPLNDTQTYAEYVDQQIKETIYQMVIAASMFDQNGYQITKEGEEQIQALLDELVEAFGGRSALNADLAAMGLNDAALKKVFTLQYKYEHVLYDTDLLPVTDKAREAYYNEKYACLKFIYIHLVKDYEYDDKGNKKIAENGNYVMRNLTEQEKQAKKEKVTKLTAQCQENPERFDVLYQAENEMDVTYYPNGFYFNKDNLYKLQLEAVADVAFALEEGEIMTVFDQTGAYIVKRCPLPERAYEDGTDSVQFAEIDTDCKNDLFIRTAEEHYEQIEIKEERLSSLSVVNVKAVAY
ncbi:MAG: hypothetical protein HFE77_02330 [Clostridiales bacterium]|nr:hypothetical protein [Clostridiales bacterium]